MDKKKAQSTIVDRYEDTIFDLYVRTHPQVNRELLRSKIHEMIQNNLHDIPCQLHNNMTHETVESSMINVFDWIEHRNPIITGNGTFFMQHSEYLAPTVKMLETLKNNRNKRKKEMYTFQKGSPQYNNANVGQLNVKVAMNADYGGSGTPLSPFYSAYLPPATTSSAKNITTSLICCLEFLSENKDTWAKLNNINELFDMIYSVLNDTRTDRRLIHATYSTHDTAKWLLSRMNSPTITDVKLVETFLKTISPEDVTRLMFAFNPRLVLRDYVYSEINAIMSYLKDHQVDIDKLISYMSDKEKATAYVKEIGYGVQAPDEIKSVIEDVSTLIVDNCVYPFVPNDAEVRAANMKRIIVCVTDTDSLMVQFAHYITDFQADVGNFKASCLIASAFGMRLFIEHIIPRMVEDIATFCNINDKYYRDKFVFKNEFAFLTMALLAKKMYATSMMVQEGNPRDPHDIGFTGLSFKKRDSPEFLEPIMTEIYDKYILTPDTVSISKVLDRYYELRNEIMGKVRNDPSYFNVLTIKGIDAYDPTKVLPSQMRGAIVWNNIMPDEEMLPMDRVRVIPLSFKLLHEHAQDYPQTNEILRLSLIDNPKEKTDPFICIPEHYRTIPDWIKPVIDQSLATDKLLMSFRQLFDAFDVYVTDVPGGFRPSRMVYI